VKVGATQIELELVYIPEALTLPTVKKWRRRFRRGRTGVFDDLKSGTPLTNDLARVISSMLEEKPFNLCKVLCRHFPIGKAMCLGMLHDKIVLKKITSSLGAVCPLDEPEE
jgi:hypothetical protein